MNILLISPYLPHPKCGHGAGVYLHGLIVHLMNRHTVSVVSFCSDAEISLAGDLEKLPIRLHIVSRPKGTQKRWVSNLRLVGSRAIQAVRSLILWEPYYVSKYRHRAMIRLLKDLTSSEQFDLIQFEFTFMAGYAKIVRGTTVLHEIDVSYRPAYRRFKNARSPFRKLLAYLEWCRWSSYEKKIGDLVDHVLTVTEQDRLLLRWLTKTEKISYLPHAYQTPNVLPAYEEREPYSLLHVGSYAHHPNVDAVWWLCSEIFPLVQKQFPDAKLYIVGPHLPTEVESFAQKNPGVKITGFVQDLDKYQTTCRVFVSPLRFGGGVKNKILNAMAYALPVVTTKIGIEGIDGLSPGTVMIGNTASSLAGHICSVLDDPLSADRMGKSGHEVVKTHYSWDPIIANLEALYGRISRS